MLRANYAAAVTHMNNGLRIAESMQNHDRWRGSEVSLHDIMWLFARLEVTATLYTYGRPSSAGAEAARGGAI